MSDTTRRREARFWDKLARKYSKRPVADQAAYEEKLAITASYLQPSFHVLEIGCGTGTTALHHASQVAHLRATDISSEMIGIAKAKAEHADVGNVDFEVASVSELDVPPGTYDAVLAHSILHLLPDPQSSLVDLHRWLKQGGYLISNTACIADFMPLFRYIGPIGRTLRLLPRVNVFSEAELVSWMAQTGFTIKDRFHPKPKSAVYLVACKER